MLTPAIERMLTNPALPSLPGVALEVLELAQSDDVDLRHIEKAIECDQAMATRMLRTVNSSYYGLSARCSSIHQAVGFLGLESVKSLMLGFSLVHAINGGDDSEISFDFITYWRRSLFCSSAARIFANMVDDLDNEEAFITAMLQDVGMVAMWRVHTDQYLQTIDMAGPKHDRLAAMERRAFETDHAEVGAAMTQSWRLSKTVSDAIGQHEVHESRIASATKLEQVLRLSSIATEVLMCTESDDQAITLVDRFETAATQWLGLQESKARLALNAIATKARELAGVLDIPAPKAEALELMLERAKRERKKRPMVKGDVAETETPVSVDPESGLLTRERLLDDMAIHFSNRQQQVGTTGHAALLLVGLDKKETSQNLTRLMGEHATRAIQQHCLEWSAAYRFVGLELAIFLRAKDVAHVHDVAATLHSLLGDEAALSSATIGIGIHNGALGETPDTLLRAAMFALITGRRFGGNQVNVFEESLSHLIAG